MFCDVDHREVPLSDWQTFVKEFPPDLISEVIDRSKLGLPPWFVPFARGVAIASHALLREARHRLGMHRPPGWQCRHVSVDDRLGSFYRQMAFNPAVQQSGFMDG
jgi:hypothetical protein